MPTKNQVHIDTALTNMSVAYVQASANFVADKVFPMVPVQKQSNRYFIYNKDDFFRDEAEERAAATESAGGDYDIDNTPSYYCPVYAYHKDVTEEDRVNSDAPLTPDQDATDFVTSKLLLRREVLWATKYFKTGVWGTEVAGVNAAPGSGQVIKWNLATSTPIKDVSEMQTAIAETTGYRPNILVLGQKAYDALKNNGDILDLIKYTQRGIITPDLLAALFDVEQVLVASAIKNSAAKGVTADTSFILGKNALLAYKPARPSIKTPSAGYTFSWTGLLGAGAYANRIVRIQMPWLGMGTERIEGEMSFDQKVVAADLGGFFNGVVD